MASSQPNYPTERAVNAARRRTASNAALRARAVWGLILVIILLLVASIVLVSGRSFVPKSPQDALTTDVNEPVDDLTTMEPVAETTLPPSKKRTAAIEPKLAAKKRRKPVKSIVINLEVPSEPGASLKTPALEPDLPMPASEPETKPERKIKLDDAEFLSTPLPAVALGAIAPARPVVLLEFPSMPENLQLRMLGLDQLNVILESSEKNKAKLVAANSDGKPTLIIRDETSDEEVATFFLQNRELRFRWKPRASLAVIQQRLRDYCVLQVDWKGHPGRYYALHDMHARDARRVREQQVRLRTSELPTGIDFANLFIGGGKLELADVYSHRFLVTPLSQRVEVPTLKQSRKDPTMYVSLKREGNSLAFQLDAPVNGESETTRRRKLFELVDGNFYLHASLYRVVDDEIKVEVLRLGTP